MPLIKDTSLYKYSFTLFHLRAKELIPLAIRRLASVNHYYLLKRSLQSFAPLPPTKQPFTVQKMSEQDAGQIAAAISLLDPDSRKEVIARLLFFHAGFRNGYVVRVGASNELAYLQWLVFDSENGIIEKKYAGIFAPLKPKQVMIENAFTFPKFRGLGLLPLVSAELLSRARQAGCTSAVAYIRKDRIESLNVFLQMGFKITKLMKEYKILGLTSRTL